MEKEFTYSTNDDQEDYVVECIHMYDSRFIERITNIYKDKGILFRIWLNPFTKEKYGEFEVYGSNYLDGIAYFEKLFGRKFVNTNSNRIRITFNELVKIYNDAVKGSVQYKTVSKKGLASFCLHGRLAECFIPKRKMIVYKTLTDYGNCGFCVKNSNYNNIEFITFVSVEDNKSRDSFAVYLNKIVKYIKECYGFKHYKKIMSYDKKLCLIVFNFITRDKINEVKTLLKLQGKTHISIPLLNN